MERIDKIDEPTDNPLLDAEKTSYETGPVESVSDAMEAFADAYDELQHLLQSNDFESLSNELKIAMYRPVKHSEESLPISMYEIGIAHFPNKTETGRYTIHKGKLEKALATRETDVQALLVKEDEGVLLRLCEILAESREMEEIPEDVDITLLRFLNECRRLAAMWSYS